MCQICILSLYTKYIIIPYILYKQTYSRILPLCDTCIQMYTRIHMYTSICTHTPIPLHTRIHAYSWKYTVLYECIHIEYLGTVKRHRVCNNGISAVSRVSRRYLEYLGTVKRHRVCNNGISAVSRVSWVSRVSRRGQKTQSMQQ
jgi:hypothetical protein